MSRARTTAAKANTALPPPPITADDLAKHARTFKQAEALKGAASFHDQHDMLDQHAFYPAHDKRTESSKYVAVHKDLVDKSDLPCLVCGVRKSTLKDRAKNPYGARALETHHHVIEWALANAVDPVRFNAGIRPNLAHRHPDEPMYQRDMTADEVHDWVDHSPDNLWVLCDVHHRAKFFGIHEISYPIWCPQDLLTEEFLDYARSELAKARGAGKENGRPPAKKRTKRAAAKATPKTARKKATKQRSAA